MTDLAQDLLEEAAQDPSCNVLMTRMDEITEADLDRLVEILRAKRATWGAKE